MSSKSQFHQGEVLVQERLGVAEMIAKASAGFIRPAMPQQHRDFFCELPMVIVAMTDAEGHPWVFPLFGEPGFISSPNDTHLDFKVLPALVKLLRLEFACEQKVGILGIQLETRRRNRANGVIADIRSDGFTIQIEQSFGNCPQYIQTRNLHWRDDNPNAAVRSDAELVSAIDSDAKSLIESADTFFIASRTSTFNNDQRSGLDASHRGGKPGFVKVEGNRVSFPDFSGNRFFNTLGNIELDDRVGLFFPNFSTGEALFAAGRAEVDWSSEATQGFEGAERIIRVTIERLSHLSDFIPLSGDLMEMSPLLSSTGVWADTETTPSNTSAYITAELTAKTTEADKVSSFYFKPQKGENLHSYTPGQFLPIQLSLPDQAIPALRTYTLSRAHSNDSYRITVKREANGLVSRFLHDQLSVGDTIKIGKPNGQFVLQKDDRAVVFISGGIGITPMMAMLDGLVEQYKTSGKSQSVWFIHSTQNSATHVFADYLDSLASQHSWLKVHIAYSQPLAIDQQRQTHQSSGRISIEFLKHFIPLEHANFYLCGAESFMQSMYQGLLKTGVAKDAIFYEFFGEGSIDSDPSARADVASKAQVHFSKSNINQIWEGDDGNLLKFAEQQGLQPLYSCRSGSCGACACKLMSGEVSYLRPTNFKPEEGEVLLCSAFPAKDNSTIVIDI